MEIIRQAFIFGALCSAVYLLYRILRTCHQIGQMVEAAINEFTMKLTEGETSEKQTI